MESEPPLLPCDVCGERATVVGLSGLPGVLGLGNRSWAAACPNHTLTRLNILVLGVTSVVSHG